MDLLLSDLQKTLVRMTDLLQRKKTIGFVVNRAGVHKCQQVKDSEIPKSDRRTDRRDWDSLMGARRFVTLARIFYLIPTEPQRSTHFSVSFQQLHRFGFAVFRSPPRPLPFLSLSLSLSLQPHPTTQHTEEKNFSLVTQCTDCELGRDLGDLSFVTLFALLQIPPHRRHLQSPKALFAHLLHFRVLLHFFAFEVCVFSSLSWVGGLVGGWMLLLLLLLRSVLCDRVSHLLR